MKRFEITACADALSPAQRRRVEAFKLAIAMNLGRHMTAGDYFQEAEAIEQWIDGADIPPIGDDGERNLSPPDHYDEDEMSFGERRAA